jgi:phosphoserine phosphatase
MTGAAAGGYGIEEATMYAAIPSLVGFAKTPWNKGRLTGQKHPLKPKEVWAIRVRLQLERRRRDLALFNLAIDSKLRGCDLVRLRVSDVCVGSRVQDRATIIQRKTGRPVQFEITEQTRAAIRDWLSHTTPRSAQYLFPSRVHDLQHLPTRQYARIVHRWVECAGLDGSAYGTHSMRRTKVAQIYKKTSTHAKEELDRFTAAGYRTLAVAYGPPDAVVLIGLIAFSDPPRADSRELLSELRTLGVRPIMVSGDAAATAATVAGAIGLDGPVCPPGKIPDDVSPGQFAVYAGVFPEDKFRLVKALQRHRDAVGMCGDGANDAPALRQAQMGIAVLTATDVAKSCCGDRADRARSRRDRRLHC